MEFTSAKVDVKRFGLFVLFVVFLFSVGALALTAGGGFSDDSFKSKFNV